MPQPPPMPLSLSSLNQMSQAEFTSALGAVFEDTPQIAAAAWTHRPFATLADLHRCMVDIVSVLPADQQLALIQAHPDLGARVRMADASVAEQAGAGLDQLSVAEYEQFQTLNRAYRDRFGFPFILAVADHTKTSILAAFEQRLHHSLSQERAQALTEIYRIALVRLQHWVTEAESSP